MANGHNLLPKVTSQKSNQLYTGENEPLSGDPIAQIIDWP
jgi:hypothetical protein